MAKPSIFSKDYERQMKMRRVRITVLIVAVIVAVAFAAIYFKKGSLALLKNNNKTNNSTNENKNKTDAGKPAEQKKTDGQNQEKKPESQEVKEEGYEMSLGDGSKIKAVYEVKDNDKKFKYITPTDAPVDFTVSPSGKAIVVYDRKAQSFSYVSIDGKTSDITKPSYFSKSLNSEIPKETTLTNNPGFIWCASPSFIDENTVAYVSQLPYFKTTKYVWIVNVQSKEHICVRDLGGEEVKFGSRSENGLAVTFDSRTVVLKADGSYN